MSQGKYKVIEVLGVQMKVEVIILNKKKKIIVLSI